MMYQAHRLESSVVGRRSPVAGRQMRNDSMKWEALLLKETLYLVLQALVINPGHQCQGLGSQFAKWGVEELMKKEIHAGAMHHQLVIGCI